MQPNIAHWEVVVEFASLEREVVVAASPEVVFEVVGRPEQIKEWWPDDASYDVRAGAAGEIRFGDPAEGGAVDTLTVVDVRPPESFTFRWTDHDLLVTFTLTPSGEGTVLKLTETGFREAGWGQAVLEETYRDHERGWDFFLPRLAPYVATLPTAQVGS
jgi:uncharacterized protein YndB with AHSA1/START domain